MTTARRCRARVREQWETHPGYCWLTLELPTDFPDMRPGQYLNLRAGTRLDPLFRRPFGVVAFRREAAACVTEIYYGILGPATRLMAGWRAGDEVDCLGPLGTPYRVEAGRPAVLVAGGRGAAPLLFLYNLLRDSGHAAVRFAVGARTQGMLFGLDRVEEPHLLVATDDGSAGHRGPVTEALIARRPQWLQDGAVLYVCGPEKFLGAAAALARDHDLGCQASLEAIYGCGLGLCRGCAVPLRGESRYLMQCVEGPVVDAHRIDWERYLHE